MGVGVRVKGDPERVIFFKAMKFSSFVFKRFFWFGSFFGAGCRDGKRSGSYLHSCLKNSDEEFSVTN